jgi:hypothetical protein
MKKSLPLISDTLSLPVVPLYASPRSISGRFACCMDCVEPVLSLRAKLETSDLESDCYKFINYIYNI